MSKITRAEENQEFTVKRDAVTYLGLIHLDSPNIGDHHTWEGTLGFQSALALGLFHYEIKTHYCQFECL